MLLFRSNKIYTIFTFFFPIDKKKIYNFAETYNFDFPLQENITNGPFCVRLNKKKRFFRVNITFLFKSNRKKKIHSTINTTFNSFSHNNFINYSIIYITYYFDLVPLLKRDIVSYNYLWQDPVIRPCGSTGKLANNNNNN